MDIFERDAEYIAHTYSRFPLEIVGGKGSLVYGADGKEYIDMGAGIAVNTFGIADDAWIRAVTEQLGKFQHTSNLYYAEPCVRLAEALCGRTGMKRVFFSNSGAEANECAIKAARKYAHDKKGADCFYILTLRNSFHGRTLTTLAATGQDVFHKDYLPLTPGFVYADANDLSSVRAAVKEYPVAAILFEAVQGEGGVLPLTAEFAEGLSDVAAEEDILLIADEVQIGNGRSGMLYGYMNFGITPDIVTTAKGIGGGLPIGVTMLGEKVKNIFSPGDNGSTFGGNPVVAAGAYNILSRLDDDCLAGVRERSAYIREELTDAKGVNSVTGMGLMLGIDASCGASAVVAGCMERGVLVLKAKDKVRLLPALNIPTDLLKRAVSVIKEVCGGS